MKSASLSGLDAYVGHRLRVRRRALGMTQDRLASLVGLAHQQIQRYEAGVNRVPASRLWGLSRALDVTIDFFFDGYSGETASVSNDVLGGDEEQIDGGAQVLRLVRKFRSLDDSERNAIMSLVDSLAGDEVVDASSSGNA